jgi:hypothetical protein
LRVEHRDEWEKLMRRGSDCDELLRFGHVVARVDDPAEWRAGIRAQVRADKLRVRTFVVNEDERIVVAYLRPKQSEEQKYEELREVFAEMHVFEEAGHRASLYGHRPSRWRSEEKKSAALCVRCGASIYLDRSTDPPILDGTAFEGECPDASR